MARGHIQRRGKRSWRIKVDAGRNPKSGKRDTKYLTVHGKKRDAERKLAEVLHQIDTGQFIEPTKLTVAAYLDRWLEDCARTSVSRTSFERYADLLRLHVAPHLQGVPLSKLQPLQIQGLYGHLLTKGRRRGEGGLNPRTVRHVHTTLKRALQQAVRWRLLPFNPADAVDPPKCEQAEVQVLDDDQVKALLRAAEGTGFYAPIVLTLNTGLRRGELLALRWRDVSLDRGELAVRQSLEQTRAGLRFKPPKTRRSRRTITVPATAVAILRGHRLQQMQERMQLGFGRDKLDLVFGRQDGEPQNPRTFSKHFAALARRAGLEAITFHGLRHTHITMLLRQNVHPKVASERAGHSSVAITLDVYSHVVPSLQADVARAMDELFTNIVDN